MIYLLTVMIHSRVRRLSCKPNNQINVLTKGEVGAVKTCLSPPPRYSLLTVPKQWFCCGSLLPGYGVSFIDVYPVFVHINFSRFRLLSGHFLGKSCSLG